MSSVVLLGDLPPTGLVAVTADRPSPDVLSDPDAFGGLLARISAGLDGGGAVVILYPAWSAAEGRKALGLLRSRLATDRLAGVPLDLPPLALSLIADQLAHMSPYVRPGQLVGLAHRLAGTVVAGAWVNSVTRLEHIEAGMGKHLASFLPGSGFAVTAAPVPGVHRITAAEPIPASGVRPADPVLMVVAHEDGDLEWVQGKLGPALGASSVRQVAVQPMSRRYWGTKRYAEYIAFCAHPRALEHAVRDTPAWTCPWCDELVTLPVCPLCSMVQPRVQGPVPVPAQPVQTPVQGVAPQPAVAVMAPARPVVAQLTPQAVPPFPSPQAPPPVPPSFRGAPPVTPPPIPHAAESVPPSAWARPMPPSVLPRQAPDTEQPP